MTIQKVDMYTGDALQVYVLTVANADATNKTAMIKVKLIDSLVEVDVEANGIDIGDGFGKDLIVNFDFEDFEANKTFYTDSNSLEMQKRIINYRPTWNYTVNVQNVTSNYYPVNSAIAMRDIRNNK